ncbi:MAG: methionine biosynthesis protein MetW [Piscirickettsiaceae bacterium CG_4_9_14_3_um_filter_43_564]|nr:methionine biosynthesis protein MetW [Thiomicrospira sp.]OIP95275.1 MAG: methionine biosynthesis protein MetW [Thiomicrospira sp. CG2_30_44_34]PIQ02979.1 MAG: methionine biosynthesis protein MetW [Piscirickettsiaceae bacterium CG18_big_fil_WC_8_21_14_2_50_44_103]PIU38515.1 MAG: methionine biosynthesis protein MetW [Piscirickettsiaceae bacterium CG07_land_8_20_14_0_80_44_28]PIW57369.1 MAG: methionine biosynthesis protein MetW [Piscirickettsiaceae bacterium CG12_big_fil_rev_8_21_14_0_65_44_934
MNARTPEFNLISEWILPNSRVLDLGCGDGTLLHHLKKTRQTTGYGMEIDPEKNIVAISRGINVIQSNLNSHEICDYFDEDSFDFVIMTQAIQVVSRPDLLIDEMLSVGKEGIITFPNFGHWRNLSRLFFQGRMPQNETLPNPWYNTANIHLCTFSDFEDLCDEKDIAIVERKVVNTQHQPSIFTRLSPNLLGEIALYRIKRKTKAPSNETFA